MSGIFRRARGRPTRTEVSVSSNRNPKKRKQTAVTRTHNSAVMNDEQPRSEGFYGTAYVDEIHIATSSSSQPLFGESVEVNSLRHQSEKTAEASAWEESRQQRFIEYLEREVIEGSVACSSCGLSDVEPLVCHTCDPLARFCDTCYQCKHSGFEKRHVARKWDSSLRKFVSVDDVAELTRFPSCCESCNSSNVCRTEDFRSITYYGFECKKTRMKIGSVKCNVCFTVSWLKPCAARCFPTSPTDEAKGWVSEELLLLAHHLLLQTPTLAAQGIVTAIASYLKDVTGDSDTRFIDPRSFRAALKEFRTLRRELVCMIFLSLLFYLLTLMF